MRILLIIMFTVSISPNATKVFAQDNVKEVLEMKGEKKSETTKKRRQKVLLCHECGKPEVECECEGEGHGVEHGESNDDKHDHHTEAE